MFKTALNWFGFTILVSVLLIFIGCDGSESDIEGQEEAIAVELTAYDSRTHYLFRHLRLMLSEMYVEPLTRSRKHQKNRTNRMKKVPILKN